MDCFTDEAPPTDQARSLVDLHFAVMDSLVGAPKFAEVQNCRKAVAEKVFEQTAQTLSVGAGCLASLPGNLMNDDHIAFDGFR
jgi:hypothetical protein